VDDVLRAAGAVMGGRDLRPVGAPLRGSDRATVVRALLDGGPATVVVKAFAPARAGEGWVREAAALALLRDRAAPVPGLLAVADRPPLVVTTDLGSGPNVADALLGPDPDAAVAALGAWADALAAVHSATPGAGAAFAAALAERAGDLPVDVDTTPDLLATAAGMLERRLPDLGVTPDPAALAELRGAAPAGSEVALSPADACPDNNLVTGSGLALVDFEAATVRHVAWDVAYLRVPWPSCWCAWRLPDDAAAAAVARWRAAVAPALPGVRSPVFDAALAVATAAWAFVSTGWFLDKALGADPPPADARLHGLVPPRRAMIQHRLAGVVAAAPEGLPGLTVLAGEVLAAARSRWGDAPLELAPAFR
jgi:hypothetical protein